MEETPTVVGPNTNDSVGAAIVSKTMPISGSSSVDGIGATTTIGTTSSTSFGIGRGGGGGADGGSGNGCPTMIGTLEKLDLRGTSVSPQSLVHCLWTIAHHPQQHHHHHHHHQYDQQQHQYHHHHEKHKRPNNTSSYSTHLKDNDDATKVDNEDPTPVISTPHSGGQGDDPYDDHDDRDNGANNLWCKVCFKELYLSPASPKPPPDGNGGILSPVTTTTTTITTTAVAPLLPVPSWRKRDLKRLELVLDMDNIEELYLGGGGGANNNNDSRSFGAGGGGGMAIISNGQKQQFHLAEHCITGKEHDGEWNRLEDLVAILKG
jgi:hypothetical protein